MVHLKIKFEAKDMRLPEVQYDLGKPAIYIYPEKTTTVNIKLGVSGSMVFSYPNYNDGWSFVANPDGNIEMNKRNYDYLFWEGEMKMNNLIRKWTEGFIIKSDTLVSFFENTLEKAGLNEKEMQDFITYWVPKMQNNKYTYVHFIFNKEYDYFATIDVQPKPNNLIRVFLLWSKIDGTKNYPIVSPLFPKFNRKGFTIIEWGGSEIGNVFENAE